MTICLFMISHTSVVCSKVFSQRGNLESHESLHGRDAIQVSFCWLVTYSDCV